MTSYKTITKLFTPPIVPEGDGARVRRIIGNKYLNRLDPFLVLDYFKVKLPAGFPDHPHRGFETVTYMLEGSVHHEDFKGNKGTINPGDLQWMTAGKGIVHAEIPASAEEYSVGFQLWINLSEKNKFCDPEYQEIKKDKIPVAIKDNVKVKVIAGESLGQKGPIYARTPALYLDVEMEKNSKFEQHVPKGWNAIAFVYEGQALFGPHKKQAELYTCVAFTKDDDDDGEIIHVETGDEKAKFLIIAGEPLNEKVVQYGPFVLNNEEDLERTFDEFEEGVNGFENAPGWESKIKDLQNKY